MTHKKESLWFQADQILDKCIPHLQQQLLHLALFVRSAHARVSESFFALEVMKHCVFGGTRFNYDAIEATALESVFVKFVERGIEDFLSSVFGRSLGCGFHSML